MPSLLVTGPLEGPERYVEAARSAGWGAEPFPLLELRPLDVRLEEALGGEVPDWICVTSVHAVASLRSQEGLRDVPCAAVGPASAEALERAGLRVELVAGGGAAELVAALGPRLSRGAFVLWPRGSRSDELTRGLAGNAGHGVRVVAPVVYETTEIAYGDCPAADAVFFASPSAVGAWVRAGFPSAGRPDAIAIGATTAAALAEESERFGARGTLDEPSPEALARHLERAD